MLGLREIGRGLATASCGELVKALRCGFGFDIASIGLRHDASVMD